MTNTPTVERLDSAELARVEALLEANDLPYQDVRAGPGRFYGIIAGNDLVGVAGLEQYGTVGLLRSVAVDESYRGRGLGTRLCESVEGIASDQGVHTLFLLTTSATAFFQHVGYAEFDRSDVPAAIKQTTEFSKLCPTSAVCMRKRL